MSNKNLTVIPLSEILYIEDNSITDKFTKEVTPKICVYFKQSKQEYIVTGDEALELYEKFLNYCAN